MANESVDDAADASIENHNKSWLKNHWRPMMAVMYMSVCFFDFVLAPIGWSLLQAFSHGSVTTEWDPLTLKSSGLFHIAMGAVLGISAYGRTQEKINEVNSPSN